MEGVWPALTDGAGTTVEPLGIPVEPDAGGRLAGWDTVDPAVLPVPVFTVAPEVPVAVLTVVPVVPDCILTDVPEVPAAMDAVVDPVRVDVVTLPDTDTGLVPTLAEAETPSNGLDVLGLVEIETCVEVLACTPVRVEAPACRLVPAEILGPVLLVETPREAVVPVDSPPDV